ncbi:MAG: hypothetical protein R3274_11390 [Desulfobacterales bacterium]|nr:hypothetical protein [Desulfobacterales bacterium]
MGGLAHYIEDEGIPTTQISLIREHSEAIKPPRALWVPFELGRPLGVPNDPDFQKRVLLSSLKLLEAEQGPVLEDFGDEAPDSGTPETIWACPVNFSNKADGLNDHIALIAAFKQEVVDLRPWYDEAVKQRGGRTTFGVSGLDLETIVDFIPAFLDGPPDNPSNTLSLPMALNFAVDDLKAYYYEAVSAQPGKSLPDSSVLENWFWQDTAVSKILFQINALCLNNNDRMMQLMGKILLIPSSQAHRKENT